MTYQKIRPLQPKDISTIRTVVDAPLPVVPVEVIDSKKELSILNRLQEYYHTISVVLMGFILYLIDYAPEISPLLNQQWQTRLSIATVAATLIFNFFKSNAQWIKSQTGEIGKVVP